MLETAETPTQQPPDHKNAGAEARSQSTKEQPAMDRQKLLERVEAAEILIQQLVTERDESRKQLSAAVVQNRKLKEHLAAAQQQFYKQREIAVQAFRKIVAERPWVGAPRGGCRAGPPST